MYPPNHAMVPLGQRKVAIPRLQRSGQGQSAAKDRRRVPRACTAVRYNFSVAETMQAQFAAFAIARKANFWR